MKRKLSLYGLKYDYEKDWFIKPDTRMKQFGDTAVIIRDFDAFMFRIAMALEFYRGSGTNVVNLLST